MSRRSPLALGLALALSTAAAGAQSRAEFDRLVRQAGAAYDAHDARGAVQLLERAYAMRPTPRLLFNLGRAHEQGEDFATAAEYYRRFLASGPDAASATVAQEALGIAERRAAQQAEERRARDAAAQNEQQRSLEEARARAAAAEQQRLLEEERRRQLNQGLLGPRRLTTPVLIAGGVAGAAAIAGGVFGGLALSAQSSFASDHQGAARYDSSSRGATMALVADVSFGTAVVAGVTALVLFLTQPTAAPASADAQTDTGARF